MYRIATCRGERQDKNLQITAILIVYAAIMGYGRTSRLRIGFYQKVRFKSVGSKFESNSNPCFSYNLTVFDNFRRRKSHQNNDFRGQFYENCTKMMN